MSSLTLAAANDVDAAYTWTALRQVLMVADGVACGLLLLLLLPL